MNPIPESFDVKSIAGFRVIMICFNANQIYIIIDPPNYTTPAERINITIEGEYSVEMNNKKINYSIYSQFPIKKDVTGFISLVEEKIEDVYTDKERKNLSIKFSNGMLLTLLFNPMYESYEIITNKERIIM